MQSYDPGESGRAAKEVIRKESFWFAGTTVAFIGFVGTLLRNPSFTHASIASVLILTLSTFTFYLLVGRHQAYCRRDSLVLPTWYAAFRHALTEASGTLYCLAIVTFSAIAFFLIIWSSVLGHLNISSRAQ